MADESKLSPYEAACAAINVYNTLSGWSAFQQDKKNNPKPSRGMAQWDTVSDEVTGSGDYAFNKGQQLNRTFEARTVGATTGFGYILSFKKNGENHAVVATRGTRPEIGPPDLLTDFYATPTGVVQGSLVHAGFANTFASMRKNLNESRALQQASHIHCVGHSLGGAIANLCAYYLSKNTNKNVNLYTFGAPRVGLHFGFPSALESQLKKENIYRVSHTNDPITWIPTFPFLHVLGADNESNNILLKSPAAPGSMANHSMATYAATMKNNNAWASVRGMKHLPAFEDRLMANVWKQEASGILDNTMKAGKLVGGAIVWVLMKILRGLLKLLAGAVIVLIATPMDLICRLLWTGAQKVGDLGKLVWKWITKVADWIGIKLKSAKDLTTTVLRYLLERFMLFVQAASLTMIQSASIVDANQISLFGHLATGIMYPI
ncbi:lipase family protein [Agaribacter marinus]|uniref:Fungal lipase-type domain-containing protein n=1 Tax=Agaribacter marinus TaxID=1431249 RepID=A0AA37SUM4_9ALTE|nr:lipase family protein [Agaribacter marinus]GLR69447.1 hypothetical protein GCM10007852_03550 [Agaribacter marinus]